METEIKDKENNKEKEREREREEGKNKEKNESSKGWNNEEIQRITVNKEAQTALGTVVDRVNNGFNGGKVNRTQMANWIMMKFNEELDEGLIKEIRADHFDEVLMLESILRQAKESGKVPTDFRALLQKQMAIEDSVPNSKKKVPKALT